MTYFYSTIGVLSPRTRGLTVSLLLLANVLGLPSLFAELLAHRFGHLRIVLSSALPSPVEAPLEASAASLAILLVSHVMVITGKLHTYLGSPESTESLISYQSVMQSSLQLSYPCIAGASKAKVLFSATSAR